MQSEVAAKSVADLLDRRRHTQVPGPRPAGGVPHLVSVNGANRETQLQRIVELEIIPRLMLMHSNLPTSARPALHTLALTEEHVDTLAHLAIEGEAGVASRYVQALVGAGASQEQIFLDLLTPCARLLGRMWDHDSVDFSQVTVGLWRLQQVLYEQSRQFTAFSEPQSKGRRVLLSAVPGSQHTFGITIVAEFFSRAGWDTQCESKSNWLELQNLLASQWFDVIGLSIGVVDVITEVSSAILRLRQASVNPGVCVMVGGAAAALMPDIATHCGADAMALDAASALDIADRWVHVKQLDA